jgi:hypothetical protein
MLDEFMDLLGRYEGSVDDAQGVRASVMEVQREATEPAPRWPIICTLLRGVASSVGGVAALTEAINSILTLLGRIPK